MSPINDFLFSLDKALSDLGFLFVLLQLFFRFFWQTIIYSFRQSVCSSWSFDEISFYALLLKGDAGLLIIQVPKVLFAGLKTMGTFIKSWSVNLLKLRVSKIFKQYFFIFIGGIFHHWGCTSFYNPLAYTHMHLVILVLNNSMLLTSPCGVLKTVEAKVLLGFNGYTVSKLHILLMFTYICRFRQPRRKFIHCPIFKQVYLSVCTGVSR